MNDLEDAFRAAGGTIEQLVRAIVRDELRRHLGPEPSLARGATCIAC